MSREQFEEELRNRIKDYSPEIDAQQLWNNIQQKKPKSYLGIFAIFFVLAGAGVSLLFLQNDKASEQLVSEVAVIEDVSNTAQEKADADKGFVTGNDPVGEGIIANYTKERMSTNTIAAPSDNEALVFSPNTIDQNHGKVNYSDRRKTKIESNTSNNLIKSNVVNNATEYDDNQLINIIDVPEIQSNNQDHEQIATTSILDVSPQENQGDELIPNNAITNNESQPFNEETNVIDPSVNETVVQTDDLFAIESSEEIEQLNNTAFEVHQLEERMADAKVSNWQKMDGEVEKRKPAGNNKQKFKSNKRTFELTVDVLGGPMFPFKSLTAKSEEDKSYLAQRQFTEQVLRGYTAEVNTYGEFKKMGYFKVGVSYAGFKESFVYKGETIREYYDPNGIQSIEIDAQGDTTFVLDSVLVTQVINRNINRINSYNMLDLSMSMGYMLNRSRWSIFVDAGIAYNLMFKANGQYLDRQLEVVNFSDELMEEGSAYKKNLGVAVVANVGFDYEIKPNLNFKIQTGFKRYFSDFSTQENPIRQKYNFLNLGLGLAYTFNNF